MWRICIITLVMTPRNDPGYDWPSLLKGRTSQLVSEHYGCNTSRAVLFLKTYGEEMLRCPYKDYSSLNMWHANWISLSAFTLCNLLFCNDAPMLRQEVKYPPAGWCESQTHPFKMRLDWGQSLSCGRDYVSGVRLATTVHLGCVDLGMYCGLFRWMWICSCDICSTIHAVWNVWGHLGDKWWCVCVCILRSSIGTLTTLP
jgi:hypothetical protein